MVISKINLLKRIKSCLMSWLKMTDDIIYHVEVVDDKIFGWAKHKDNTYTVYYKSPKND